MRTFHAAFLALFVGTTLFFTALSALNVRHGRRTLDREREWVRDRFGLEDVERVSAYQRAGAILSQLETWAFVAATLVVLYSGALASVVEWFEGLGYGPVATGTLFFVSLAIVMRLFSVPFELYSTFVVEERFDFNQQTPGLFVRDFVLGTVVAVAITIPLAAAVLWFVSSVPTYWPVAALVLFAAFSLTMLVVYPRFIAPLFNDFEPIEQGDLREAVERVFERAGFTCDGIYLMDASRRSSHSNAYFVGFGRTKRVVLFDTLVEQMRIDEIEGVLAHELAHWKRAHIWKQFGASLLRIGAMLVALWYLLETTWLYGMFDLPETAYVGLLVGALWLEPISKLTRPLENKLSLAHEREADAFATDVMGSGQPLIDALCRLTGENLSNPFPHPWYATFHYTHPPIPDRIRYIQGLSDGDADDVPSAAASGAD